MKRIKQLFVPSLLLTTFMSYSTLAHHDIHEVNVNADKDGAFIVIESNGRVTETSLSMDELTNPEKLESLLSDLPEQDRSKVLSVIGDLSIDNKIIKFSHGGDDNMVIVSGEKQDDVIIFDIDKEAVGGDAKKIVKRFVHKNKDDIAIELDVLAGHSTNVLIDLIDNSSFTAEQLDALQHALDQKR